MEPFSSFMGFYRVISWLSPIESSTELRSILSTDSWNRSFLFQKDFTRISNGTSALSESTSAVFFFLQWPFETNPASKFFQVLAVMGLGFEARSFLLFGFSF